MTKEKDEALVKDFPYLFKDRGANMQTTCMYWGFECGDGWEPLIRELCEKLEPLCKKELELMTPEDKDWYGGGPRASQFKEKYGTLRFYMTTETNEMSDLINAAEEKSSVTCEQCGNSGTLRGRYWYYTACIDHTQEDHLTEEEKRLKYGIYP